MNDTFNKVRSLNVCFFQFKAKEGSREPCHRELFPPRTSPFRLVVITARLWNDLVAKIGRCELHVVYPKLVNREIKSTRITVYSIMTSAF